MNELNDMNPYAPSSAHVRTVGKLKISTQKGIALAVSPSGLQLLVLCGAVLFSVRTYETNYLVIAIFGSTLLSEVVPSVLYAKGKLSLGTFLITIIFNTTISVLHFAIASAIVPT